MPTDLTKPDPAPILDLISAFRTSQILFASCELRLFELLQTPQSVSQLASAQGWNADATERLLDGATHLGLLTKSGDTYQSSPMSQEYLTEASRNSLLGYINYSNAVLWKLWDNLPDAVREGGHRWKQTFGTDGPIFAQIFRTDADKRQFLLGMHSYGLISSPQVVNAVDLGTHRSFCDLGGATGHLAVAACQRWANLSGVVFDLPEVVPLANEMVSQSTVAHRVQVIAGDFFADALPVADVYAVGRILHDWTEAKINKLLKRIHDALPSGGMLLIAEKVLHDDKTGPAWSVLQSLNMLLVTEGRERTLAEYTGLLEAAGFKNVTCTRTGSPLDAITAMK
jgi:acetylserotonin O-methyltransferase